MGALCHGRHGRRRSHASRAALVCPPDAARRMRPAAAAGRVSFTPPGPDVDFAILRPRGAANDESWPWFRLSIVSVVTGRRGVPAGALFFAPSAPGKARIIQARRTGVLEEAMHEGSDPNRVEHAAAPEDP